MTGSPNHDPSRIPRYKRRDCVAAQADPHHTKACQLAATFVSQDRRRITTTAVLAELGDGFVRKGRWDIAAPFLAALLMDSLVTVVSIDANLISRACDLRNARLDKDFRYFRSEMVA